VVVGAVAAGALLLLGARHVPGGDSAASPTTSPAPTGAAPGAAADADLAGAAAGYLDALRADDFEAAYAMTTEGFREAQPFDGFVDFWSRFDEIVVDGDPSVDAGSLTVTLALRLDGQPESYPLQFVRTGDGTLLVDGPRPR
jgi:hypothetical protein